MKALLGLFRKRGRKSRRGALVFWSVLLACMVIACCALREEPGRFLVAVASGIAISIVLRLALDFDPEE